MSEYDQTSEPEVVIGHVDLISWLNDLSLYLDTQLVYEHILLHYE